MSNRFNLSPQPNFPFEDLLPENARMLSTVLSCPNKLFSLHADAEETANIYAVGHRVLKACGLRLGPLMPYMESINYGISTYEAIAHTVRDKPASSTDEVLAIHEDYLRTTMDVPELMDYMVWSGTNFSKNMEQTVNVVGNIAEDIYSRGDAPYAQLGAAAAYQFERDTWR